MNRLLRYSWEKKIKEGRQKIFDNICSSQMPSHIFSFRSSYIYRFEPIVMIQCQGYRKEHRIHFIQLTRANPWAKASYKLSTSTSFDAIRRGIITRAFSIMVGYKGHQYTWNDETIRAKIHRRSLISTRKGIEETLRRMVALALWGSRSIRADSTWVTG